MIVFKIEDCFYNLTFKSNDHDVIENIVTFFGAHKHINTSDSRTPIEIEFYIEQNADGEYIIHSTDIFQKCKSHSELLGVLLCLLYEKLPTENFIYLHGGEVSKDESCIAILAPSNGGKTTVVMGLLENGFSYRSDDIIPICKTNNQSFCFPKPVFIRENSPYRQYSNTIIENDEYKRYVWLPNRIDYIPKKLTSIFLLNRDVQFVDISTINILQGAEKIKSVLYNIYKVSNAQEAISYVANLLRCTPVYRIDYFTTNQAVCLINQVVKNERKCF